jgi:hypothetical protein
MPCVAFVMAMACWWVAHGAATPAARLIAAGIGAASVLMLAHTLGVRV